VYTTFADKHQIKTEFDFNFKKEAASSSIMYPLVSVNIPKFSNPELVPWPRKTALS
jgi:hypothetical protein